MNNKRQLYLDPIQLKINVLNKTELGRKLDKTINRGIKNAFGNGAKVVAGKRSGWGAKSCVQRKTKFEIKAIVVAMLETQMNPSLPS